MILTFRPGLGCQIRRDARSAARERYSARVCVGIRATQVSRFGVARRAVDDRLCVFIQPHGATGIGRGIMIALHDGDIAYPAVCRGEGGRELP